jgi:hypothetical protein
VVVVPRFVHQSLAELYVRGLDGQRLLFPVYEVLPHLLLRALLYYLLSVLLLCFLTDYLAIYAIALFILYTIA